MTELEQLKTLCKSLGAPDARAEVMARQLIKRADQLKLERGTDRVKAMAYLLDLLIKGRSGELPVGFEGGGPGP